MCQSRPIPIIFTFHLQFVLNKNSSNFRIQNSIIGGGIVKWNLYLNSRSVGRMYNISCGYPILIIFTLPFIFIIINNYAKLYTDNC